MEGRYPQGLLLALTNCTDPSKEEEFNAWYNHMHVPDVTAPGIFRHALRFVNTDHDSVLAYATEPRIAAVMLFSQEMTKRGEADMARMTHALIDRVLEIGGTYYLPYRPHASLEQLSRGYPRAAAFAAAKRQADPGLCFRNALWDRYFSQL